MLRNKTIEISHIENLPYKIAWIHTSKNKNSFITYKKTYKNIEGRNCGKFDKCTDITLKDEKIKSFSVINCEDHVFENKMQNYNFCKKLGPGLWKISSLIDTSFYVDDKLKTCFDNDLVPILPRSYQIFETYIYWVNINLNSIKIDTYYDKIYLKKIIIYGENKKPNRNEVENFLLCCNRVVFLPELIPEILKFIRYI